MKRTLLSLLFYTSILHADVESPKLILSGQGIVKLTADIADVALSIQVQGKKASDVQKALAEKQKPVLEKLKVAKLAKLETGQIQIVPEYDDSKPPLLTSYSGHLTIFFTTDASLAGEMIDKAIAAGANQLLSVSLRPSDEKLEQARLEALTAACKRALQEADTVSKALGIQTTGIVQANVEQAPFAPYPINSRRVMALQTAAFAAPEVTEQEQQVAATVQIQMGIKQ